LQKIPRALNDLPKTLDETYERTLQCIDEEKWEYTCRIFQFLTVSARPPRVEELAEIFAIEADGGTTGIPEFNPRWRSPNSEAAVLAACSSLVTVVNVYGDQVVQFAHFSVREFLVSDRLQRSQRLSQFHVVHRPAHTFLAKACLTILLQLNSRIHKNSIGKMFPLATYAAQYWVGHAQRGDVSSLIESGMESLFDGDKPYFAPWIWVYDVDNPSGPHMDRTNPGKPEATPLYYAALCGFLEMVERLIDTHPSDVDTRASDGGTPLHAALRKGHSDVALFLLGNGADAKAQNSRKETPLHLASRQGDIKVMKTLMKYGADLDAENGDGETPLSLASSNGMPKAAGLLLDHGAGADNRGSQGRTALHVASENGHHGIVRLLANKGAAIDARDRNDRTPLHLAADKGKPIVAKVLLDQGANVDARDAPEDWTPLHLASSGGRVDIVRLLLNCKADVNAQDEGGWTALHLAAYNGHEQVGEILLEHGADWYRKNDEDKTPFDLALESHHGEMEKLLSRQASEGTRG
jgi:ankyrin repeat protein